MKVLLAILVLCPLLACDENAAPGSSGPESSAGKSGPVPEWGRYEKTSTDLRDAKADVEKRIDAARSRLTECHKGLVASARTALPPDPQKLVSSRGAPPSRDVLHTAPINPEGVRFLKASGDEAKLPCGASEDDIKAVQDELRKVMATVPFTPKGARECHPDTAPHDAVTLKACEEGIAFLTDVHKRVVALGARVTDVVPEAIEPLVTVIATDREFCEQAKTGVQFTRRTLYAVSCSRTRYWVDLPSQKVVGELTRLVKQPGVKPKDPDPSGEMLDKAQEDTAERAARVTLDAVNRASGLKVTRPQ